MGYASYSQKKLQPLQHRRGPLSQAALRAKLEAGEAVPSCASCGKLFLKSHRCRNKAQTATEDVRGDVASSLKEKDLVEVLWEGGDWYQGRVLEVLDDGLVKVLYDDPDDPGPYEEKLYGAGAERWRMVDD